MLLYGKEEHFYYEQLEEDQKIDSLENIYIYIWESAQKCVCAFLCELNINWTSFSVVMSEWSRRVVVVVV